MGGSGQRFVITCRRILRCDMLLLLSPAGCRCCVGCVSGEDYTSRCGDNSRGAEPRQPHDNTAGYSKPSRLLRFVLDNWHAAAEAAAAAACACADYRSVLVYDMIWHTFFFMRPYDTALRSTTPKYLTTQLTEEGFNRSTPPPPYLCAAAAAAVLLLFCCSAV